MHKEKEEYNCFDKKNEKHEKKETLKEELYEHESKNPFQHKGEKIKW